MAINKRMFALVAMLLVSCTTSPPTPQDKDTAGSALGMAPPALTGMFQDARIGNLAGVQRELAAGEDPNQRLKDGITPLMLAALNGHADVVRALLAASANANAASVGGYTALHGAAYRGYLDIVRMLIAAGANVNVHTAKGYLEDTPLTMATMSGRVAVAEALLKAGADPNAANELELTPLMDAAYLGNLRLVSVLLAHGADPHLKRKDGTSAIDLAREAKHGDVVALLAKYGQARR